jgi:hypothetical protein
MQSSLTQYLFRYSRVTFIAAALATAAVSAHADNLVVNGGFESTTIAGVSSEIGSRDAAFDGQNVTGWTTTGYNFVFVSGDPNADSEYGSNDVAMWGPGNGGINGNPDTLGPSPDGGNFVAMDGPYAGAPMQQTITGLLAGSPATLTFYWAAAQQGPASGQNGFLGDTTEQFQVSLGSETHLTGVIPDNSQSFNGWYQSTMTFTPTSSTEVLSFLAVGTPASDPPFVLLDGVSLSQTPEPSSLALLATGLLSVGSYARMRFKKA